MIDELAEHLEALARDECYRVDAVLKKSLYETTERVFFRGENGAEFGPFVRKTIDREAGIGIAYENICSAQRTGRRFQYLPRIFDCHTADNSFVVVMEHVGGETLAEVVYRCDPSVALACDVFPRLCNAVSELHEGFSVPLIHRDLKPSNIMLSSDAMTIIDFGIARTFKEGSDEDTHHFGTRAYAPPEQFGFGQTDVRSDVYALGMLLYFCLTEKTPDAQARKEEFVSSGLPEVFRAIIIRATELDPADRYASATELKSAFVAAVGMPIATKTAIGMSPNLTMPAPLVAQEMKPVDLSESDTSASEIGRQKERTPRTLFGMMLSRIPRAFGVVWDIMLAALFVLFFAVSVVNIFNPSEASTNLDTLPFGARVMSYSGVLILIGSFLYLVADRRPVVSIIPALARISLEREVLVCLVGVLIGIFCVGIAPVFFPQANFA